MPFPKIRIVSYQSSFSSFGVVELWLEFAVEPGQALKGSEIETYLSDGILEVELPSGEKKTFQQVPSPSAMAGLGGVTFENFSGFQWSIRIPLGELLNTSIKGQYQVSWYSADLRSNTLILDWSGEKIIIREP